MSKNSTQDDVNLTLSEMAKDILELKAKIYDEEIESRYQRYLIEHPEHLKGEFTLYLNKNNRGVSATFDKIDSSVIYFDEWFVCHCHNEFVKFSETYKKYAHLLDESTKTDLALWYAGRWSELIEHGYPRDVLIKNYGKFSAPKLSEKNDKNNNVTF